MTDAYAPGDRVIWTNPANRRGFKATIVREVASQSPTIVGDPASSGAQPFPSVSQRERRFEIRLKETGATTRVFASELCWAPEE
jgi:hypothetical protein